MRERRQLGVFLRLVSTTRSSCDLGLPMEFGEIVALRSLGKNSELLRSVVVTEEQVAGSIPQAEFFSCSAGRCSGSLPRLSGTQVN